MAPASIHRSTDMVWFELFDRYAHGPTWNSDSEDGRKKCLFELHEISDNLAGRSPVSFLFYSQSSCECVQRCTLVRVRHRDNFGGRQEIDVDREAMEEWTRGRGRAGSED